MSRRKRAGSDYACQYRAIDSPIHRMPSGLKLLVSCGLCAFALMVKEALPLLIATTLSLLFYFLARLTILDLWRDIRFFLVQLLILESLFLSQ
jgi:energy-coupling factor transporter transmembrane protein EcfT